jgi:hypothetical protein
LSALGIGGLEATELVAPAVVGLFGHPELAAQIGHVLTLAQHPISLPELAHDLLRRVPLPRVVIVIEPSCPLRGPLDSHSTWINQPGSGQRHSSGMRRSGISSATK